MKKTYIPSNQIGLFEFLNQQEQKEKLVQLQEDYQEEEFEESTDCYLGYQAGLEHSILIHDYEYSSKKEYDYEVVTHRGYIYIGKQPIGIDIWHTNKPSLHKNYWLTLEDLNELQLPNCENFYEVWEFKDLEDLIKFIKSELKDKSLIIESSYETGNED